jgi:hypothetical protein
MLTAKSFVLRRWSESRRLSPLFYEDGQIFLIPRPPRPSRGKRGSAVGWWTARSKAARPGSAEAGASGLPLPGLMRESGWASLLQAYDRIFKDQAGPALGLMGPLFQQRPPNLRATARALTGIDTICGGSVSANELLLLRAVSQILWPGKTSEVVFRRGKTKKRHVAPEIHGRLFMPMGIAPRGGSGQTGR